MDLLVRKKILGIKLDVEKAYDTISWKFLRSLLDLGFDSSFVDKIMYCVSSPMYRILVNCMPSVEVKPYWGFRQGDPLSPYLYILCGKALIQSMWTKAHTRKVTFPKLSPGGSTNPVLQFADDLLFFLNINPKSLKFISSFKLIILRQVRNVIQTKVNWFSLKVPHQISEDKQKLFWELIMLYH